MKKIIVHRPEQVITIENIPDCSFIGIKTDEHGKYLLSGVSKSSIFTFVNGKTVWDSNDKLNALLRGVNMDGRVEIHIFTDLKLLGKWLLED